MRKVLKYIGQHSNPAGSSWILAQS